MTLQLRSHLKTFPILKQLKYQGRNIEYYAGILGFINLCYALFKNNLDKVALNHNIVRPRLVGYDSDLIWEIEAENTDHIVKDNVTSLLEENYVDIKDEILSLIKHKQLFPDSDDLTNSEGRWDYIPLFQKSGIPLLSDQCPKTHKVLEKININLVFGFCFVSVLEKNTTIKEHRGSSNLRQRYHLGISIPKAGVSRIKIGDHWTSWKDGEAFGFNDAVLHSVEHLSDEPRIILIVDTWHPLATSELVKHIKEYPQILNYGKL